MPNFHPHVLMFFCVGVEESTELRTVGGDPHHKILSLWQNYVLLIWFQSEEECFLRQETIEIRRVVFEVFVFFSLKFVNLFVYFFRLVVHFHKLLFL